MKKTLPCLLFTAAVVIAQEQVYCQKNTMADGPFSPSWESLSAYEVPEWFKDAKFGIWAHWGPQCQPEAGDWYARAMYEEGSRAYKHHLSHYGHPSEVGFKDVMNEWKAENWEPRKLMALYKRTGARYFMALGNHHDNMDLWDSPYQSWNSVRIGPHRDILAEWKAAADEEGLPFGVSIHSAHAWTWYEPSQGADRTGEKAGISYDARTLRKADGKGKWWEGLDPEELYVQNHSLSNSTEHFWDWPEGVSKPSQAYLDNFYNRTTQMMDAYHPDLVYFDDSWLPFWPIDSTGLEVVAHYYNVSAAREKGKPEVVVFGKKLTPYHSHAIVRDVEKGVLDSAQTIPWQTCTCLGNWHYDADVYNENRYKSAETVIQMLIDIVSKNGNLLLSVPLRGDGTIDDKEEVILAEIGEWLKINGEGIYATRPWKIFGEGPSTSISKPLDGPGFNEQRDQPYTSEDIRFTTKGDFLYAHVMTRPDDGHLCIKSLKGLKVRSVEMLGEGKVKFKSVKDGLSVRIPSSSKPGPSSITLKIKLG